jgi:hypothetical protein
MIPSVVLFRRASVTKADATKVGRALDALALALADHSHRWSDELRNQYERAVQIINSSAGCKETGSPASAKSAPDEPSRERLPLAGRV